MRSKNNSAILNDNIPPLLIRLTIPSVIGMLGLMIFNVVDTYFVGKLGARELAAVSFTFPVVLVLNSITMGLGIAVMSLFSRAVGRHDRDEERLLATSSLILGVLVSMVVCLIGFLTMEPLFRLIGVDDELMPLVESYMRIWYLGAGTMVLPMMGDHILRGLGDTKTPAYVMLTSAVTNIVLDPLMIFGIGPFPEMGIKGAALATILSRSIAAVVTLIIQIYREKLISFRILSPGKVLSKWKTLFYIGLPNAAIKAIVPLGAAVFTSILARYGHESVAGYGVAAKIETVAIAFIGGLGITAAVFVGQNLGAGKMERVKKGIRWLTIYCIVYSLLCALFLALCGRSISGVFNEEPGVSRIAALYLMIVPAGYLFYGLSQIYSSILNVYHKPMLAGSFSLVQIGLVSVPLSYILSPKLGEAGVFLAIGIGFAAVGLLSLAVISVESRKILIPSDNPA